MVIIFLMKIISYREHSFESLVKHSRPGNRRPVQLTRPSPASNVAPAMQQMHNTYLRKEYMNQPISTY